MSGGRWHVDTGRQWHTVYGVDEIRSWKLSNTDWDRVTGLLHLQDHVDEYGNVWRRVS